MRWLCTGLLWAPLARRRARTSGEVRGAAHTWGQTRLPSKSQGAAAAASHSCAASWKDSDQPGKRLLGSGCVRVWLCADGGGRGDEDAGSERSARATAARDLDDMSGRSSDEGERERWGAHDCVHTQGWRGTGSGACAARSHERPCGVQQAAATRLLRSAARVGSH